MDDQMEILEDATTESQIIVDSDVVTTGHPETAEGR
jgi:hypothetical protein